MREKRFFSAADNIRMSSEQKEKLFNSITAEIDMAEDAGTEIICESKSGFRLRNLLLPAAAVVLTGIAVVSALPSLQRNETIPGGNDIPEVTETGTEKPEITDSAEKPEYTSCMYEDNYLIGSLNGTNYFAARRDLNETSLCISPDGRKLFTGDGDEFTEIYNIALYEGRYVVYGNTGKKCRLCVYDSSFENPVDTDYTGTADSILKFTVSGDTLVAASWTRPSDCRISSFSMQTGKRINQNFFSSVLELWNIGVSGPDELKAVIVNTKGMLSVLTLNISDMNVTDSYEITERTPEIFNCAVRNGDIIISGKNPDSSIPCAKFTCYSADGTVSEHILDKMTGDYPLYPADSGSGFDFLFLYYGCIYGYTFETDRCELLTSQNEWKASVNYRKPEASFDAVFFRYNDEVCRTEHISGSETLICSDAECSNVLYTLQDDILEKDGLFTRSFNDHVFWLKSSYTHDSFTLCDLSLTSGETEYTDYAVDPDNYYFPYEFAVTDKYLITHPDTMYNSYGESIARRRDCLFVYSRDGEFIRRVPFNENEKYTNNAGLGYDSANELYMHHLFITDRQEPVVIFKTNTLSSFDISAYVLNSEADAFEKYDQEIQPYMFASAFQTGTNGYSFYWIDRYGVNGYRKDTGKSDSLMAFPDGFCDCVNHNDDQFTQVAEGSDGELYLNCRFHGVMKISGLHQNTAPVSD